MLNPPHSLEEQKYCGLCGNPAVFCMNKWRAPWGDVEHVDICPVCKATHHTKPRSVLYVFHFGNRPKRVWG